jgi:hypothetical protein
MKKYVVIICLLTFFVANSQNSEVKVEKSVSSFQIGTVGTWINNEIRLSDEIALRIELGLYTEITEGIGFFMAPEITLEPRWYYNIKKRASKELYVSNNSANFFTIKTNFRSSVFEISNYDEKRAENSFAIIPKWGIRRNLGTNFNYELGLGIGYLSYINQKYNSFSDSDGIVIDLHLRIGYNF